MFTVNDFQIETARLGQTVRHVLSQKCFTVADVRSQHVVVKSTHGQFGIVGPGALPVSEFVALDFPPFDPILN